MRLADLSHILVEQHALSSHYLKRYVLVDVYVPQPSGIDTAVSLLILNDGQNLDEIPFATLLNGLSASGQISPLLCVGIHCNKDRIDEYGTAAMPDYAGRGKKAKAYQQFITEELIPFIHTTYAIDTFEQKAIAGFSMGGLSAIDTLWNYPDVFSAAGVFSGSLWWRSKDLDNGYNDDTDRIMHQLVRSKEHIPGKRFYFTTGSLDETADRNNNGVIDSIDDTLDLIKELERIGYKKGRDIRYVNDEQGKHDIPTWGKALPQFLLWLAPCPPVEEFRLK